MDLNVNSVFYACRAVAPIMKAQGGGVILNTSSMVSLYGQAAGAAYPTSKWAINGLTKSLARELAQTAVPCERSGPAVSPAPIWWPPCPGMMVDRIAPPSPCAASASRRKSPSAFLFLAGDLAAILPAQFSAWTAQP